MGKEVRQGGNLYLLFKNSDTFFAGCVVYPFLVCDVKHHLQYQYQYFYKGICFREKFIYLNKISKRFIQHIERKMKIIY